MYLTGADATDPIGYCTAALKSTLQSGLAAAPWQSRFSSVGGILVTDDIIEARQYLQAKRPHIFLDPGECEEDENINFRKVVDGVVKPGARWNIKIEMDVVVSMYSASAEGYAKAAIKDIVKRNYTALRDLGIEASDIRATDPNQAGYGRICPHTFSCNTHLIY